jgi:Na+-driven multidrug efflux pump
MVAGFSAAAVAAFGVAGRIEMFAFMIPMTVGMSLIPFVAQNFGAGRMDRVRTAYKVTTVFALCFGLIIAAAFTAAALGQAGDGPSGGRNRRFRCSLEDALVPIMDPGGCCP